MAIIRSKQDGALVQVLRDEEIGLYAVPEDMVFELELDQETNADILNGISRAINGYRLVGETLTLNGDVVTINPPTEERQRLKATRRENVDRPLDMKKFRDESDSIQSLAKKIAWLEQELRVLQTKLGINS